MVAVAGAGVMGAAAQGAAFGLALAYANGLEADRSFDLVLLRATPREDLWLLYAVGAAVTLSLLTAVGLLYYFQRGAVRLGKDYEDLCIRRTLSLASHLPHPNTSTANGQLDNKHLERLLNDARLCGRVLRLLATSVVPFVVAPATVVIMFVLNPLLSVVIAFFAVLGATSLYRVNVKGARASKKMEALGRDASQQRRGAVDRVLQSAAPLSEDDPNLKRLTSDGAARRRLDAYAERLEAVEESSLVTGALSAVTLGIILTVEGRSILQGTGSVSMLVAYVAVLRLFVTNFMKLGRAVSGVSRFYPQIRRHFEFTDDASSATMRTTSSATLPVSVATQCLESDESRDGGELAAGSRMGVITSRKVDRALLARLSNAMSIGDSEHERMNVRLVTCTASTGQKVADAFGFPSTIEDPRQVLPLGKSTLGFVEAAFGESGELNIHKEHVVASLNEQHRFVLSFLSAVLAEPHVTLLSGERWLSIPRDVREELDELAGELVLAYAGTQDEELPVDGDVPVILVAQDGVVGWGSHDWVRQNRKQVKRLLRSSSDPAGVIGQSAIEDEEELE